MKMGFISEIIKGLTIEKMGQEVNGNVELYFTNGAVLTLTPVADKVDGLGIKMVMDADWDEE